MPDPMRKYDCKLTHSIISRFLSIYPPHFADVDVKLKGGKGGGELVDFPSSIMLNTFGAIFAFVLKIMTYAPFQVGILFL